MVAGSPRMCAQCCALWLRCCLASGPRSRSQQPKNMNAAAVATFCAASFFCIGSAPAQRVTNMSAPNPPAAPAAAAPAPMVAAAAAPVAPPQPQPAAAAPAPQPAAAVSAPAPVAAAATTAPVPPSPAAPTPVVPKQEPSAPAPAPVAAPAPAPASSSAASRRSDAMNSLPIRAYLDQTVVPILLEGK